MKSGKQVVAKNVIWEQKARQGYAAKKQAVEERFPNMLRRDDVEDELFMIMKQMARTNQNVDGEKCTRNDHGDLAFGDYAKEEACKNYYSQMLNQDFVWGTMLR